MTKTEIINIIAEGTGLTKVETAAVVDGFIASISYALKKGESVELRGFGTFKTSLRKARKGRNPRTGEELQIPERTVPTFRCSKDFRNFINTPNTNDELNQLNSEQMEGGE